MVHLAEDSSTPCYPAYYNAATTLQLFLFLFSTPQALLKICRVKEAIKFCANTQRNRQRAKIPNLILVSRCCSESRDLKECNCEKKKGTLPQLGKLVPSSYSLVSPILFVIKGAHLVPTRVSTGTIYLTMRDH